MHENRPNVSPIQLSSGQAHLGQELVRVTPMHLQLAAGELQEDLKTLEYVEIKDVFPSL